MKAIRKQQVIVLGGLLGLLLTYQQCAPVNFQGLDESGLSGKGLGISEIAQTLPGEIESPPPPSEMGSVPAPPEPKIEEPKPEQVAQPGAPASPTAIGGGGEGAKCKKIGNAEIEKINSASVVACPGDERENCAVICHIPPGNPAAMHTIMVGLKARDSHVLRHGDVDGPCGGSLSKPTVVCQE